MNYSEVKKDKELYRRLCLALYHWQNGQCPICLRNLPIRDIASQRLVLDHDHSSGEVRGLLCSPCNTLVGFIEHKLCGQVMKYLEDPPAAKANFFDETKRDQKSSL